MADNRQEQRYVIQHYCRQETTAYEVFEILKMTYSDATLPRAMVYRWYTAFRSGRESSKLKGGSHAPRTKLTGRMVNTAAALMQDDARMMVRCLANILQIAVGSSHHLLTEILRLSCVGACWIPRTGDTYFWQR